jgi:hypothetical protein
MKFQYFIKVTYSQSSAQTFYTLQIDAKSLHFVRTEQISQNLTYPGFNIPRHGLWVVTLCVVTVSKSFCNVTNTFSNC